MTDHNEQRASYVKFSDEVRYAPGAARVALGTIVAELDELPAGCLDATRGRAAAAQAVDLASIRVRLRHIAEGLPLVRCWCVTSDGPFDDGRRPTHWSGHATEEEARAWTSYWDAWCDGGRAMRVEVAEISVLDFYAPGSTPPPPRSSRG